MKTSIVLSTYNGEKFIIEQLESLKNQTCPADEVIIGDDCSTDTTYKIIEDYIEKNQLHNWFLKKNAINKGWRRNFVELVGMAKGDLIYLCDQDDIWSKDKLGIMNEIMVKNSKINVLVSFLTEFFDNGKRKIYPRKPDGKVTKIKLTRRFMNVLFPGCTYCIRSEFARFCEKYWTDSMPHDGLYWRLGLFDESLYVIRLSLINQRKHEDSTFTVEAKKSKTLEKKKKEIVYTYEVLNSIERMLADKNDNNVRKKNILNKAYRWNDERKKMFEEYNLLSIIRLILFIPFYQTMKRFILDAYIILDAKCRRINE